MESWMTFANKPPDKSRIFWSTKSFSAALSWYRHLNLSAVCSKIEFKLFAIFWSVHLCMEMLDHKVCSGVGWGTSNGDRKTWLACIVKYIISRCVRKFRFTTQQYTCSIEHHFYHLNILLVYVPFSRIQYEGHVGYVLIMASQFKATMHKATIYCTCKTHHFWPRLIMQE